ncbi:DUF7521 family protein [Haloglomus litoreum]|uniref:DUF7521 family protein n=1 Tax=Haloglomus litoreum TaxID=3034026 RepID=UPI0023E7F4BC|nr:hypothetical protein [Haloglomus sp. DT116]
MFPSESLLASTKLATLVLGSVIAVLAQRAYRRTGNRSLRALALGFGLLASGGVVAGLLHTLLDLSLLEIQTVQSLFTAAALAVIVRSLLIDDHPGGREMGHGRGSTDGRN